MIEKIISINLPENLFSDEQNVRKIIAEFNVKDSPNSRRIVGTIYNSDGLEKFGIFFKDIKHSYFKLSANKLQRQKVIKVLVQSRN